MKKYIFLFFICCQFLSCAPKQPEQSSPQIPTLEPSLKVKCSISFSKTTSLKETAAKAIEIKQLCNLSDEQVLDLAREASN
jgi:hypothetical protein